MGKRENKKSNYLCFEITATILFENTLWVPSRWFLRSKQSLSQIWHLNAFLESTLSLLRATSWKGWFNKLKTSKSKNTIRQRVLNLCKLNWSCKEHTYFFLYQFLQIKYTHLVVKRFIHLMHLWEMVLCVFDWRIADDAIDHFWWENFHLKNINQLQLLSWFSQLLLYLIWIERGFRI